MGQIHTAITDIEDYSLTSGDLAATACCSALNRVRAIMAAPASAAGVADAAALAGLTGHIDACFAAGRAAVERNDLESAVLEQARAVVLMNSLLLVSSREGGPVRQTSIQKSGMTA